MSVGTDEQPWWARRWHAVLDDVGASHARAVQRGRATARRGGVDDLTLRPGRVDARVREDRVSPYQVTVRWPVADDRAWSEVADALAGELRLTAALLDDDLPEDAAEVFAERGVPLTPSPRMLERRCTCADGSGWCRHVAAVHTAAGLAMAREPSLLLQLRGRRREQLLRQVRAGSGTDAQLGADVDLHAGLTGARGDLDAVPLHPHPVEDPSSLLRQLGDPPGVDDPEPLIGLIERAAATAWRLAAGDGAEAADEELLLAELRAQRTGTASSLAEALARDEAAVREQLDQLFHEGTVLRTGSGERTRYRAP